MYTSVSICMCVYSKLQIAEIFRVLFRHKTIYKYKGYMCNDAMYKLCKHRKDQSNMEFIKLKIQKNTKEEIIKK